MLLQIASRLEVRPQEISLLLSAFTYIIVDFFGLLLGLAGACLTILNSVFEQLLLPIVAGAVRLGHVSVALSVLCTHVSPSLSQVLHHLLGGPLGVQKFEDFPLLRNVLVNADEFAVLLTS